MGRTYHLFCSEFNAGAAALAEELKDSSVFEKKGKKASAPLTFTSQLEHLTTGQCDHMLVLLDKRTWTSGEDTAKLVEHIHEAMWAGVHIVCVHEFPSLVGPERHDCEFNLMFGDDWTPAHLTGGDGNLYMEIALALKGAEWRLPGLVAFASKLTSSAGEHEEIDIVVPASYQAKAGPNSRCAVALEEAEPLPRPVAAPMEAADVPAPLVVADAVDERGSLVLEDDATYVQAVVASSNVQANAQEGAGLVQVVTSRLKGLFMPSAPDPADAGASASSALAPAAPALEADHGDLHA
jgi:hypothetical protein